MPFDPAQPADHAPLDSQVMRDQLNGLNDRISALEATFAAALAGTALDPTVAGPFNTTLSDPPSAAQVQAILDVHNQLVSALKRS